MKQTDAIQYLKSYSVYRKFLHSQKYAKEYFDVDGTHEIVQKDECREKMNLIKALIDILAPSNEHTMLHLHYIKGIPVEKCAECMGVSTRTAYRMLNKGHKAICDLVSKKERSTDERAD